MLKDKNILKDLFISPKIVKNFSKKFMQILTIVYIILMFTYTHMYKH